MSRTIKFDSNVTELRGDGLDTIRTWIDRAPVPSRSLGPALMILGTLAFALNDAFMVTASRDGAAVPALFFRALICAFLVGIVGLIAGTFRRRPLRTDILPMLIFVTAEAVFAASVLAALLTVGMGRIAAVLQAAPIMVMLLMCYAARERIGLSRLAAVFWGGLGIVLVLESDGLPGASGLVLAGIAVIAAVIRDLSARSISRAVSSVTLAFLTSLVLVVGLGLYGLASGNGALSRESLSPVALASGLLVLAYVLSVASLRRGDTAIVVLFRYSHVPFAALIGWLFLGESLSPAMVAGVAAIVFSGCWLLAKGDERPGDAATGPRNPCNRIVGKG